jgi:hypothetical protein
MFDTARDTVATIGPLKVVLTANWPHVTVSSGEGRNCGDTPADSDGNSSASYAIYDLREDDLVMVNERPCKVVSAAKWAPNSSEVPKATLLLLDPRMDDNEVFRVGELAWAAAFGMAVPTERMYRALRTFSGYVKGGGSSAKAPGLPLSKSKSESVPAWLGDVILRTQTSNSNTNETNSWGQNNSWGKDKSWGSDNSNSWANDKSNSINTTNTKPPFEGNCLEDSPSLSKLRHLGLLSPSQEEAIRGATSRRLSLIQGPPGTGKTHCGAALIIGHVESQ